jgi:FMN phosphatase YigB (HAD superfamily)/ribulose-5-phosphate 4-epimerase/fuculose-1-phosphate aldolase
MFYKGIILDLDNTLYSYDLCHSKSLNNVLTFLQKNYNTQKNYDELKDLYDDISNKLKYELKSTASSHNKSIYFKQLIELLNLNYSIVQILNDLYWKTFFEHMVCFEGVNDFIVWNKNIGVKIGVITDYETEYQMQKLEKLGLINYIDTIITSEEVGIEKPSIQMFQTILRKMELRTDEVIMIGDDFNKDVKGALNTNIHTYWFNSNKTIKNIKNINNNIKYIEFTSFQKLYYEFNEIHNELIKLKQISKYCGERFDLVQAGGGNTSVKINNLMFIKASGYNLTNIDENSGYVAMNNETLLNDIYNNTIKEVTEYNFIGNKRGSIETFMHAILKKYTIHLHPIQVNRILVTKEAKKIIKAIYPSSLIIDYFTPGIKVCNEIKEKYNNENVIFLINHGIIITSDNYDELYKILEEVISNFEIYQKIDFLKYKNTNKISSLVNNLFNTNNVSYICEDATIKHYLNNKIELFKESITFPDFLIYCGLEILFDLSYIEEYKNKYNEPPKIIINDGNIYINSISITKCKEIEEVLKSNLIILDTDLKKNVLSFEEICFLNNWDAEKYRKTFY